MKLELQLTEECWSCSATGLSKSKACEMCEGTGKRATDTGVELMEFIEWMIASGRLRIENGTIVADRFDPKPPKKEAP